MATQLQIRRGTTAQMNAFTGAEGELAVNTTTDTLHVHDGATAGGKALARADGSNIATYAGSFTTLTASGAATLNTLASSGATLTGGTINGVTVGASTPSTGAFTTIAASGAITGNVTGNLTGSILTAAQTNITSVGTLSTLAVTGTATMDGLTVDGNDSYTSNIKFDYGASAPTYFANWGYKSSSDGNKVFLTITDGGAAKDVLVANYNGNVGIGTSSINTFSGYTTLEINNATNGAIFDLSQGDTMRGRLVATTSALAVETSGSIPIVFQPAGTEAMRIDSAGNVGIGLASPSYLIHADAATATDPSYFVASSGSNFVVAMGSQNSPGVAQEAFIGTISNHALKIKTNNTEGMRIESGNLLVGRTSSLGSGLLTVHSNNAHGLAIGYGTGTNEYRRLYHHSSGLYFESSTNQAYLNSAGVWTDASDITYKKEIEDIDYGIETVKKLKPRKYKMKSDDTEQIGFVAQELVEQVPEIVSEKDGILGVAYGQLTAVLTKAIQEQQATIEALTQRIQTLENN